MFSGLLQLFPTLSIENPISNETAELLYRVWKGDTSSYSDRDYRKVSNFGINNIQKLVNEGLLKVGNEKINITQLGKNVLKVMILGDDRSIFDDDGRDRLYSEALAGVKEASIKRKGKFASRCNNGTDNWWHRNFK